MHEHNDNPTGQRSTASEGLRANLRLLLVESIRLNDREDIMELKILGHIVHCVQD